MFNKFKNFVVEHQAAIAITTVVVTAVTMIAIELATDDREPLDVLIIETP
jgi:hypothetical protein